MNVILVALCVTNNVMPKTENKKKIIISKIQKTAFHLREISSFIFFFAKFLEIRLLKIKYVCFVVNTA